MQPTSESLFDFVQANSLTLAALIIAVLGIVIGYLFYRKGRRFKRPTYSIKTQNLITNYSASLSGLEVRFGQKPIQSLSVSKIIFWNDGPETIDRTDLAVKDPLRIELKGGAQLLDAKVVQTSSDANQFNVETKENQLKIAFDYLDQDDGGVIQVIHTGGSGNEIIVAGSIKGVKELVTKKLSRYARSTRRERLNSMLWRIVLVAGLDLLLLWVMIISTNLLFILVYGALGIYLTLDLIRDWVNRRVPGRLVTFFQE